jgi:NADH-quinone oxidoreductase subunit C
VSTQIDPSSDEGAIRTVYPGSAASGAPAPATQRAVPHRGGPENPSARALRARFPDAVRRVDVVWGETTMVVAADRLLPIVIWLHDDPGERYGYLVDVTAVEFRDREEPLTVVWHLRSLDYRRFLRLKVEIP